MPRIRAIKRSGNGRVRPWNGVRDEAEREECSLTLELPGPGKEAFYWLRTGITRRTTNASRRYETLPFFITIPELLNIVSTNDLN